MTVFSELFQAHSRDVYRFALFLSGDHDLAEDIVSETFIRVWHARDRLDLTTVKAYLLAIARNLFLDGRRRARDVVRKTVMTITRDVVRDLLAVYLAGDASADTRALVEEYLARDPALKAEADGAAAGRISLPPTPPSSPTAELQALAKTRELMKTRTSTLVTAVLFTALPFAFTFSGGRITFVMFRDAPVIAAAWWFTAAVLWGWHVWVRRRLAVTGV